MAHYFILLSLSCLSMKRILVLSLLPLALSACQKETAEPVPLDYPDWYALRSPEGRAIEAVYGDIDKTLVVSTGFAIYQTKDRGKTWLPSTYNAHYGIEGFIMRNDTLLNLTATVSGNPPPADISYAVSPLHYSVNYGATWLPYRNWSRKDAFDPRVALNRATSPSGTEYSIDVLRTPTNPGSNSYYVETVGIKSAAGKTLPLPHDHDITSISFDAKSRLYVTASAALCGHRENFAYCGERNGVLYVSKNPQP